MKNKLLASIVAVIAVFTTAGCGKIPVGGDIGGNETTGRFYNIVTLQDKGVNMFTGIIPEGWTASINSENLVNSSYPFVETVVIANPDQSAKITILSQHSYTEDKSFNEGVNQDY